MEPWSFRGETRKQGRAHGRLGRGQRPEGEWEGTWGGSKLAGGRGPARSSNLKAPSRAEALAGIVVLSV